MAIKYIPSSHWGALSATQLKQYKKALKEGEVEFMFLTPSEIKSLNNEEKAGYNASYDKHNVIFKTPSQIYELPQKEQEEYIKAIRVDFKEYAHFMQKSGCALDKKVREENFKNFLQKLVEEKESRLKPLEKEIAKLKRQIAQSGKITDNINDHLRGNLRYNLHDAHNELLSKFGSGSQENLEFQQKNNGRTIDEFHAVFKAAVKKNDLKSVKKYFNKLKNAGAADYILSDAETCVKEVEKRIELKKELETKIIERNNLEEKIDKEHANKKEKLDKWNKQQDEYQEAFLKEANCIDDRVHKYTINSLINCVLLTGAATIISAVAGASLPIVLAIGFGTYITSNIAAKIYREGLPNRLFTKLGKKYGKLWFPQREAELPHVKVEEEVKSLDYKKRLENSKKEDKDPKLLESSKTKKASKKDKENTIKEEPTVTTVDEEFGEEVDKNNEEETINNNEKVVEETIDEITDNEQKDNNSNENSDDAEENLTKQ